MKPAPTGEGWGNRGRAPTRDAPTGVGASEEVEEDGFPPPREQRKGVREQRVCRMTGGEWGMGYWAVKPPSMTSSLPVMKEDSSEARKRAP